MKDQPKVKPYLTRAQPPLSPKMQHLIVLLVP